MNLFNSRPKEMYVAYLDLMGFKELTKQNPLGAIEQIQNLQETLRNQIDVDEGIAAAENSSRRHAFHHIIPFSDSIFLTSGKGNGNEFLRKIALFLSGAYCVTESYFNDPLSLGKPSDVAITHLSLTKNGVKRELNTEYHCPTLFTGGISFGEVTQMNTKGKFNGEELNYPNLTGYGVVDAVATENRRKSKCQKIYGPCILLTKRTLDLLSKDSDPLDSKIFRIISNDLYEFLWPAVTIDPNSPELSRLVSMFRVASRFVEYYKNENIKLYNHYIGFKRIIEESAFILSREAMEEFKRRTNGADR